LGTKVNAQGSRLSYRKRSPTRFARKAADRACCIRDGGSHIVPRLGAKVTVGAC